MHMVYMRNGCRYPVSCPRQETFNKASDSLLRRWQGSEHGVY